VDKIKSSLTFLLVLEDITVGYHNREKRVQGIVHFEINFWYGLAYLKGIQDVGVFVSTILQEVKTI